MPGTGRAAAQQTGLENPAVVKPASWRVVPDSPPDTSVNGLPPFTKSFRLLAVRLEEVEGVLLFWVKYNLAEYFVFPVDLNETRSDFRVKVYSGSNTCGQ